MPVLRIGLFVALAMWGAGTAAQIYAGRSADGTIVLSDFSSLQAPTIVVMGNGMGADESTSARLASARRPQAQARAAIGSIVSDVARDVNVSASLLHAVIAVESDYDPKAVSPRGAQGLMQLMPATARRFGVADPFDPRDNVRGGALYLKWLLDQFRGDLRLAIAGYNAGEEAVIRSGYRVPPYAETQRYVPRVMARMQQAVGG